MLEAKAKARFTKIAGSALIISSLLLTSACADTDASVDEQSEVVEASESTEESPSADETFLEDLVEAWVARWDLLTDPEQAIAVDDSQYAEKYKAQVAEAVELELDKLDPYRGIEFSDDDLGARAANYIGLLDDSMDSLQYMNVDDSKYQSTWFEIYDRRTIAILEFVDVYELEVPEQHANVIVDMRLNAELAESRGEIEESLADAFCSLDWYLVDSGYGSFDYEANVTNPLDIDFSSVWVDVSLIDADGVNRGTEFSSITNWRAGQTALIELYFLDSQISNFDISVQWETSDGGYGEASSLCD